MSLIVVFLVAFIPLRHVFSSSFGDKIHSSAWWVMASVFLCMLVVLCIVFLYLITDVKPYMK